MFNRKENSKSLVRRAPVWRNAGPGVTPAPYEVIGERPQPDTLPDYLAMIRRRGWLVVMCMLMGLIAATIYSLKQRPMYQSRASLEVQTLNTNFLNTREVTPTNEVGEYSIEPYVQNQAELIRDERLLGRVVDRLNLTTRPGFSTSRETTIRQCMGNLGVRPLAQAHVIRVTFDWPDPLLASLITNAVVKEFIQQSIETRRADAQSTTEWLNQQVATLKDKLEASENELQTYAQRSGLLYTDQKNSVAEEKLRVLQSELSQAQADRIAKESTFKMATASNPDALPQNLSNGQLQEYQAKLTELKRQRAELATLLTPNHYKIQRLDAQIVELQAAIKKEFSTTPQRLRNDYQAALDREQLLADAYARQKGLVTSESNKAIHYSTLLQQVETTRALHAQMVQRAGQAALNAGLPESNMRMMAPATVPLHPYKPNVMLNSALGLFSGLFLGVTIAGVKEFRDRTYKVPGELSQSLCIEELGAIPAAHCDPGVRRWRFTRIGTAPIETVTREHGKTLTAESFRNTVASLCLPGPGNTEPRLVAVTSAGAHEGKTTLVSNLGFAFAETDRRVLLINGDLRQPRLNELFGIRLDSGLTDLLADTQIDLRKDCIAGHFQEIASNLSVMPAGGKIENISALLHSARLPALMNRLRHEFDFILIDTPPALQIADARLIARACDGVVLVVRAGHTSRSTVESVAARFEMDNIPILGTILNDWDPISGDRDKSQVYLDMYRRYYQSHR